MAIQSGQRILAQAERKVFSVIYTKYNKVMNGVEILTQRDHGCWLAGVFLIPTPDKRITAEHRWPSQANAVTATFYLFFFFFSCHTEPFPFPGTRYTNVIDMIFWDKIKV